MKTETIVKAIHSDYNRNKYMNSSPKQMMQILAQLTKTNDANIGWAIDNEDLTEA